MDTTERIQVGKQLSYVLRHDPVSIGIELDEAGWANVEELLRALAEHGQPISRADLDEVVATNDKQRFTVEGDCIRAAQGHTLPVRLGLSAVCPPAQLYHGTTARNVATIRRQGLKKGERHHVHLSPDPRRAARVGARRGPAVVLVIDADAMARDGHAFYRSGNGVWLTDRVPARYIRVPRGD